MQNRKKMWQSILCIALVGCVCCLGYIAWHMYQQYQSDKDYREAKMQVEASNEEAKKAKETEADIAAAKFTGERDGEAAELPEGVSADVENPVDFDELQRINPDLYAWIRIEGTQIDYPIAQRAGDDAFYLSHDLYQEPRFAGCIYTEEANSKEFTDPNTVIYGHNMKNGSMFQNLHLFEDTDFFNEHKIVYIYLPDRVLAYVVFAAYTYDNRHILNAFDFTNDTVYAQYLNEVLHVKSMGANIRGNTSVTIQDRIITLSTCASGETNARYLVQAVLVKDEASQQDAV